MPQPDTATAQCFRQEEASLVAELLQRNGRASRASRATPPGYHYQPEEYALPASLAVDGPVVQIAAHPGDGPDFFYATYLQMASCAQYCNDYHEILLTDGERGMDGWLPAHTRQVRSAEASAGARLVGSQLHFLGYPDGGLPTLGALLRARLVRELATLIGSIQPRILIVHPDKNDHPDHAHTFLLTVAALQRNAVMGRRAPTLLIHDVEFGLQQTSLCRPWAEKQSLRMYPLHSPELIVDITATHTLAQQALQRHQTQMVDLHGRPKAYADLIDTLARVRGLQYASERALPVRGQGFSHLVLPGITSVHNAFPQRLPARCLYRRVRSAQQVS
ncbi:MAG TPA: PIG-L deacetylase family protein [Ktedonobacteraceae bacterium]|jgi:LmbE family N-acetylglucosaminyl deacetylase